MTQRHRQGSAGVVAAAPPPGPRAAPAPAAPQRRPEWETLFASLSPDTQRELLDLADRQGVLYAHQLPAVNGVPVSNAAVKRLQAILEGQNADLEPVCPKPVAVSDTVLDAGQRDAVARALGTPDLCLIQGLPGTGKSRTVAEIVRQATARGERVLLMAPTAPSFDRVLEQLQPCESVCAVRCLGREERAEQLSPAIRGLLYADQARSFQTNALRRAREAVQTSQEDCRRHAERDELGARLAVLAAQREQLDAQADAIKQQRADLPRQVAAEATENTGAALAERIKVRDEACRRLDTLLADLRKQQTEQRARADELTAELATLRPLADAKKAGRWWSVAWWKATVQSDCVNRCLALEEQAEQTQRSLDKLTQQERDCERERSESERQFASVQERLLQEEIARRNCEFEIAESAIAQEKVRWQEAWDAVGRDVGAAPELPPATTDAIAVLRTTWTAQRLDAEKRSEFAAQWLAYLLEDATALPARFGNYVNVVAATTTALAADPHFGDGAPHGGIFDLLVLKDAEAIAESEFLAVARRARRWVLVGEPSVLVENAASHAAATNNGERGPRVRLPAATRPAALHPGFFARVWQQLHSNPSKLPYAWRREKDRLCCQLRPVPPDQRNYLETESVADHPDIELRILTLPHTPPFLTEIVFPPSMSILDAKAYIFREVQELAVWAPAQSLHWTESASQTELQFDATPLCETLALTVAPGVCERVAPLSALQQSRHATAQVWYTTALQFDRAAGWDRSRAGAWVGTQLGLNDSGRTCLLDVPHRMDGDLARFLSPLLPGVAYRMLNSSGTGQVPHCPHYHAAVEFVPVPPLTTDDATRPPSRPAVAARAAAPQPRAWKGGAGLEMDLSDWRFREHFPGELRPLLPKQGLVNYLEAQAVVRTLESLVQDYRARAPENGSKRDCHCGEGALVVLALYPAQVELIRQLVRQSAALTASGVAVEVETPETVCRRDCSVLLISLTRSHTHRAVSYADDPQRLVKALTRARSRLILFGDAGTLLRRSQWQGRLDHLDEPAAQREREVIAHLVRHLQGRGAQPAVFHLHEGSRA
jgi:hypothetical protein